MTEVMIPTRESSFVQSRDGTQRRRCALSREGRQTAVLIAVALKPTNAAGALSSAMDKRWDIAPHFFGRIAPVRVHAEYNVGWGGSRMTAHERMPC